MQRAFAIGVALIAGAAALGVAVGRRGRDEGARCGTGFVAAGARCLIPPGGCPATLSPSGVGCDAPDVRVLVPATAIQVGPADWEAEQSVAPRTVRVASFRLDAFEVTRRRWAGATDSDGARAATRMTRDEAAAFCAARGGRLPTEDEWMVAAVAGSTPHRYPWGDTGAVCRRAAWGLLAGPCANGGDGPDTVGAHPDGDTPLRLHDLAGNVAEWVAPSETADPGAPPGRAAVAKGGSWQSSLASDLRVWARLELPAGARDPRVGFRCAYAP